MQNNEEKVGFITAITGPMFSEKSGQLINLCHKYQMYGNKSVKAYKPSNDNRFSEDKIVSRMGISLPADNLPVEITEEVINKVLDDTKDMDIVAFDEGQFFKKGILTLVRELAYNGKYVIVDGLNTDYRGKEFGYIGGIVAMADEHITLKAFCACCKSPNANFSQRLYKGKPSKEGPIVMIGDKEAKDDFSYEPRCIRCFVPPEKVR